MSPAELLAEARDLVGRPSRGTAGLWPRAAAVLARQALEDQMTITLTKWISGIEDSSARTQLICLRSRLDDREMAEEVSHTWWALTNACHHRVYELPPTATELERWIKATQNFIDRRS